MRIEVEENSVRIDKYLIDHTSFTRSKIQNLMNNNHILVNGKLVKTSYKVKENDIIDVEDIKEDNNIIAEDIKLDIVYEDDDVIIVNKESGMVVHPAVGNKRGTLVNALLYHFDSLSTVNGDLRPGIVHRIDADTTGLLIVAKNDKSHLSLAKQLEEHSIVRKYIALVDGVIHEESGTIDAPIKRDIKDRKKMSVASGGKKAITHFKVLERYKNATLIECSLETGRTHQIRVHMKYINHPLVNDKVYSKKKPINDLGQALHAKTIGFIHPTTNKYMEFTSELPKKMIDIINEVKE